jgi:hypothetical protein
MKALKPIVAMFGLASCLAATTGCEVSDCSDEEASKGTCVQGKSLKRFEAEAITKTAAYVPGQLLNIESVNGEVDVKQGAAGQVSVTFKPFNYRAYDAEAEAAEQLKQLVPELTTDANNVLVKTTRGEANQVGADIEILLPPEFNGSILARHLAKGNYGGGDIDVDFVGAAPSININNDSLIGGCFVTGTATITSTTIRCNDDTTVTGVSDFLDIAVKGIGDSKVQFSLASISPTAPNSVIATEDAEIIGVFPAAAANFTITAETKQGAIIENRIAEGCTVGGEGLNKSVTCGTGGPNYRMAAGQDGVGDANVTISIE